MDRISATYLIETPLPVEVAAASLAGEQSTGTFVAVPGETGELKQRFAARVEKIKPLETVNSPALPDCHSNGGIFQRAELVVSWSVENMGFNLPVLVSTLQGNLYELSQFSGLKLMDLELPPSFAQHFRGPKFGVAGTRQLTGVEDRPLIGTIIKPSIGLTPGQTAELVGALAEAGIDFIKDDELMANPPHSPFDERVDAIMRVISAHTNRTGKKVMYAFNLSDELDAMLRHYEKIVSAGGTAAMVSLNSVGLAGVKKICDLGALAIHGHRNGWGMLNRHPVLGIEFPAYQKLWRLAGVDQIHVNGIGNKFWESDDSVVRSIESCLKPLFSPLSPRGTNGERAGERGNSTKTASSPRPSPPLGEEREDPQTDSFSVLPVLSSGQWGGQAPETYRRTKTVDLLYLAGGGIMAHPDGVAAGVRSLRRWWEAAAEGLTMEQAVAKYPELKKSLEKFGKAI
ncbi:MAG TPA: ribulose-bisphosphate carboxylase large subunit family protein [Verrucomicrobiae bacterium]|nr:ribulose-bisphosphate carboxylase large subunit family protein [Verrucomicrobiae bacterium]